MFGRNSPSVGRLRPFAAPAETAFIRARWERRNALAGEQPAESGDRFAITPVGGGLCWLEDRRKNPNDFPELTESTWARFVAPYHKFFPNRPHYVKAVHMPHAEPAYRAEYDRIFRCKSCSTASATPC